MHYRRPPMTGIHPGPITLLPAGLITWLGTYRLLYSILLGPLIFTGLCLHYWLALNLVQFESAMVAALILLVNVYFYVLRKRNEEIGLSIWIDLDEIQLLKKGIVLYKDSLKNLRVIQPRAASKDAPSTLLIEGKNFPKIFIRSMRSVNSWPPMESVDFCVASEQEWTYLRQALGACEWFS